jgi:hypothetical protein
MISEKKRLQVANVCYANVAGQLAMFCNPKNRGPNFTWDWFVEHCEQEADLWMMVANVRGHKETIKQTAKSFAREIAQHLTVALRHDELVGLFAHSEGQLEDK